MVRARFRAAVSPLRRNLAAPIPVEPAQPLPLVDVIVATDRPAEPVHCLRPAVITEASERFVAGFPGEVLYAVKCNPEPSVLRAVRAGGVKRFDCASPAEIALVRQMFPEADIHYMHPVKARSAIRQAFRTYAVRDFALDSADELAKILDETSGGRQQLGLIVRLALPKGAAVYDLSGKFGASPEEAATLLRAARPHAARLGLCFHVGSQCLEPTAYARALELAGDVIAASGVAVDIVDVGGGFPVSYPDVAPPALAAYFAEIAAAFARLGLAGAQLWAEPGRALVASGTSLVVQVQLRRDGFLYINDGIYGSLSDAGVPGFRFPCRLMRPGAASVAPLASFELFGPTCDSADRMRGPFLLPDDIREGDWIEIGQLGAYGACLRTAFNGFDRARLVEVGDRPMLETAGLTVTEEDAAAE
jgi:ornithine decarboxylase